MLENVQGSEIAIVGASCRVPGANNLEEFWKKQQGGVESIRFFSENELRNLGIDQDTLSDPNYVKAAAFLSDPEAFDAAFFNMGHREAEITDPQHRVLLECAWTALEDAGYDPTSYSGAIATFAGATINTYALLHLAANADLFRGLDPIQLNIGNAGDFLATRIAYKLNLRGPCYTIQSACSTSLVAVHAACEGLLNGQYDMALAGGVSVNVSLRYGYRYSEGGIVSPDGHCRPFDADARGTIFGSGAGMVVLKRLEDALADRDHIYAVILGSAVNNDGSLKVGYTAPSAEGQAQVISEALANAGADASTISYVEAHGTATQLGDPVEIQALTKAFRADTDATGYCAIGSVKSNIGHLDAAAGIAGLIKTALALKHKKLPPSLHFERPNHNLDLDNSPFYVNTRLKDWEVKNGPRRAGVSAFGVGGTNVHMILQEAPSPDPPGPSRPWHLLVLSARTETALATMTADLADHLSANSDIGLADVAFTLQKGRRRFIRRRFVVARDAPDAVDALGASERRITETSDRGGKTPSLAFLFPGQGAQYVNMGRQLYECEPVFRWQIDSCASIMEDRFGLGLLAMLYPEPGEESDAPEHLQETAAAQPALFAVEYALAQLWLSWGIRPDALAGHSIGEYVAACLAGVFTLEDALVLVTSRGRLMQGLPGGAMIAVPMSECELQPFLNSEMAIAAINGPSRCTVAGTREALRQFERQLGDEAVSFRRLRTSHAFHSPMMKPVMGQFAKAVAGIKLRPPQLPYLSNVSGRWITTEEATDPDYWVRHICATVRFADNLAFLLTDENVALLELGPGQTLSRLAQQHPAYKPGQVVVPAMRQAGQPQHDVAVALTALGRLWSSGIAPDWTRFYGQECRQRLALPTYPFDRRRYWIDAAPQVTDSQRVDHDLDRRTDSDSPDQVHASTVDPQPSTEEIWRRADLEDHRAIENDQAIRHPRPELPTAYVQPGNDHERIIAEIWQKALGVEKIGVLDNFFDLGGDSLIAIQAAAELKKAFQVDLPVVSMYEGLTIRSFAKLLSDIQREQLTVMTEPPAQSEKSQEDMSRRRLLQRQQRARRDWYT